jgi:tripartite-type tricarboxylate transporter receptor subunit TctC
LWLQGAAAQTAGGSAWPNRTIKIVVPLPPGGANDYIARMLADHLRPVLNVPIVVENRFGAGARIGTEYVARAAPDGYTFLLMSTTHVIVPSMVLKLPYDALKDFEPVSMVVESPAVLLVNAAVVPAHNIGEFFALARAKPGTLAYGTSGTGTGFHLTGELLKLTEGVDMLHVPYKGTAPLTNAILAGEVAAAIVPVGPYVQHVRSGRLRALAISTKTRTDLLPEVPTLAEAMSRPGFGLDSWLGVAAPAGTPKAIVDRLSAEIRKIVQDPPMKQRLLAAGYGAVGSTPAELGEAMKEGAATYARIVRDAKIPRE